MTTTNAGREVKVLDFNDTSAGPNYPILGFIGPLLEFGSWTADGKSADGDQENDLQFAD